MLSCAREVTGICPGSRTGAYPSLCTKGRRQRAKHKQRRCIPAARLRLGLLDT